MPGRPGSVTKEAERHPPNWSDRKTYKIMGTAAGVKSVREAGTALAKLFRAGDTCFGQAHPAVLKQDETVPNPHNQPRSEKEARVESASPQGIRPQPSGRPFGVAQGPETCRRTHGPEPSRGAEFRIGARTESEQCINDRPLHGLDHPPGLCRRGWVGSSEMMVSWSRGQDPFECQPKVWYKKGRG